MAQTRCPHPASTPRRPLRLPPKANVSDRKHGHNAGNEENGQDRRGLAPPPGQCWYLCVCVFCVCVCVCVCVRACVCVCV